MRAVWLREFGGPEKLVAGSADEPVAGPAQVLIDVVFANLTFVETQFRASGFGPQNVSLPLIQAMASAATTRQVGLARDLGAEVVIDYHDPAWTDRTREAVGALDVVFDGVGGTIGRSAFSLLARGGLMLSFGLASGEWTAIEEGAAADRGVAVRRPGATPDEMRTFTTRALAEAAAGRLRAVIGQRFPLERAADAHAAIESRSTIGKTLLEV